MSNQFYPLVVDALQTTIPTPDVKFVFLPCQAPLTLASEGYVVEVIQEALKQETRRRFSMTVSPVALMVCVLTSTLLMCAYTDVNIGSDSLALDSRSMGRPHGNNQHRHNTQHISSTILSNAQALRGS
jgi:hypothetical protein